MDRRKPQTRRLRIVRDGQALPAARGERPPTAGIERALAEMATRSTQARTLAEADRLQLSAVHALVHARSSFVCRLDAPGNRLLVSCTKGRNDPRISAAAPGEGLVGQAFAQERILRSDDVLAVPLSGPDGAVGCLVLVGARLELSDDLLRVFAAQVVAAAEVARLRDEGARRRKDLETAVAGLKGLEKNREQLLANVSHDLKNPLTTIKTYLSLMERGNLGPFDDKAKRAVDTCQRNADRLLRMINDLLLISRLEGGEMQLDERPFGFKAVVEDAMRDIAISAQSARVAVKWVRGTEVFVRGNRERLREAVFNVLENVIQRSPVDGEVEVELDVDPAGVARLSVGDSSGAPRQEDLDHAFDVFYRAGSGQRMRRVGAELGLPIAARIVRLHGGRVAAHASGRGGSALDLYLPSFAAAVAPTAAPHDPRDGAVLLVEDDRDCRDVLQQVLAEENYPVVSAATCAEALGALETLRPGLVLLDLMLSDGDGLTVLEHIRATPRLADVPVYVVSGASDAAELTARRGPRVDGLLEKPLQLGRLLDVVASAVRPLPPRGD